MDFCDKVILVTGAGSGIGKAIAEKFANLQGNLSIADICADNLENTALMCEKVSGKRVIRNVIDLTKDDEVKKFIKDTVNNFGKIDVVVNSAGVYGGRKLCDPELMQVYDRTIDINLRSIVAVTNFVVPVLIESKGCMINISSVSGNIATDILPYNIQKAALNHFTKCVASELAPNGVRVNGIICGAVKTNLLVNAGKSQNESDAYFKLAVKSVPLQVLLKSEEVAELAAFLASEKSRSITGVGYVMDAGVSLVGIQKLLK